MATFNTHYVRKRSLPETNSGETIVERAGYIPPKIQIENMIIAGHRLQQFRKEQYDFQPGQDIDEDFDDPTRDKNFDLADASQLGMAAQQALTEAALSAEREAIEKSLKEVEEKPPQNVQD